MVDDSSERKISQEHGAEGKALSTSDANAARNAGVGEIQLAHEQNHDKHSGSAGGDKKESIQIDFGGGVLSSREKPTSEGIATASLQQSISIAELQLLAEMQSENRGTYSWAKSVLKKFDSAQNLPPGDEQAAAIFQAQDMADMMAKRGKYSLANADQEQVLIASKITPVSPVMPTGEYLDVQSDATNAQIESDMPIIAKAKEEERKPKVPINESIEVKTLNAYDTDINSALQQSSTLADLYKRMAEVIPWTVNVIFQPHPDFPDYNSGNNTIYIDTSFSPGRQVDTFGHELYHATHQSLDKLYNRKTYASEEEYMKIRMDGEAGAFLAEYQINKDLNHSQPVVFEYVENNAVLTQDVTDLIVLKNGKIDEEVSRAAIAKFLTNHRAPQHDSNGKVKTDWFGRIETNSYPDTHREQYRTKYKPHFEKDKANLKKWLGQGL